MDFPFCGCGDGRRSRQRSAPRSDGSEVVTGGTAQSSRVSCPGRNSPCGQFPYAAPVRQMRPYAADRIVTVPVEPSTRIVAPSGIRAVAPKRDTANAPPFAAGQSLEGGPRRSLPLRQSCLATCRRVGRRRRPGCLDDPHAARLAGCPSGLRMLQIRRGASHA